MKTKAMTGYGDMVRAWQECKAAALATIRSTPKKEPTARWKKRILLAEHSPIRTVRWSWQWQGLPYWVSVHFVRHKIGIEHWVSTQRTDRTGEESRGAQDAAVDHMCEADAQALINISRRRLCGQASPETRKAWAEVVEGIREVDPILASVMVPECIYRGFCPEFHPCGYCGTKAWTERLEEYREVK